MDVAMVLRRFPKQRRVRAFLGSISVDRLRPDDLGADHLLFDNSTAGLGRQEPHR